LPTRRTSAGAPGYPAAWCKTPFALVPALLLAPGAPCCGRLEGLLPIGGAADAAEPQVALPALEEDETLPGSMS